jgi:hypothetical protein
VFVTLIPSGPEPEKEGALREDFARSTNARSGDGPLSRARGRLEESVDVVQEAFARTYPLRDVAEDRTTRTSERPC